MRKRKQKLLNIGLNVVLHTTDYVYAWLRELMNKFKNMDRIERLKDLIPKLKANKKIQPLKIECLEWELKYLESEKKQLSICDVVSSKKPYYMLVNKNGNPITTDSKLPIFG